MEEFVRLLRANSIDVVVDVRSSPYSKYVPQYNGESLRAAITAGGMEYMYMGKVLGGRPAGPEYYDAEGHVRYGRIAGTESFSTGIAQLLKRARTRRVVIVCNEEDPAHCHRRLLVGRVLEEKGVAVKHIRGDGRVQTEADLRQAEEKGQQAFSFVAGDRPWKSTRSVSPERRPRSSSKR